MVISGKPVWLSDEVINRANKYAKSKFGKLPKNLSTNTILYEVFEDLDNRSKVYKLI